jgi:hypothetical protein
MMAKKENGDGEGDIEERGDRGQERELTTKRYAPKDNL